MAVYAPPREIVPIWNKINFAHSDVGATEDWCILNFLGLIGGQISGSLIVIQNTRLNTLIATTITTSNLYATIISSSTINTALLSATNIYNKTITTSKIFATTLTSSNIYSTTISASIDINTALLNATTISSGGTSNLLTINNSTLNTTTANITNVLITGTTTMTGKLITTTQAIISQLGIGNNASTFSFTEGYASQLQIGSLNSGNDYGFSMAMSNVYARFRETATTNQLKIGTNMSTLGVQDNILYPSWSLYMGNDNFHINQARAGGSESTVFAINNIACTIATTLNVSGYCNIGSLYCGNIACVAVSCSSIYASGNCLINGGFNVVGGCNFGSTLGVSGAINCSNILCAAVSCSSIYASGSGLINGGFNVIGGCNFGSTLGVSGAINCSNILCAAVSCSTLYNSGAVVHASTVSIIGVLSTTNIISSSITNSTNISIGTSSTTSSGFIYLSDGSLLGTKPVRISNNNSLKTEYFNGTIWNQLMSVSSAGTTINSNLTVNGSEYISGDLGVGGVCIFTGAINCSNVICSAVSCSTLYSTGIVSVATTLNVGGSINSSTGNITTLNTTTGNITNFVSSVITNSGNISIGTSSTSSTGFIYLSDGSLLGTNPIRISNVNTLKTEYYNGTIWNTIMAVSTAGSRINSNLTVVGTLTASSISSGGTSTLLTIDNSTLNTATISSGGTSTLLNIRSSAITNSGNISIGTSSSATTGFLYINDNLSGVYPIRISNKNNCITEYYDNISAWNTLMTLSSNGSIINSKLNVNGVLTASSITTAGTLNCGVITAVGLNTYTNSIYAGALFTTGTVNCAGITNNGNFGNTGIFNVTGKITTSTGISLPTTGGFASTLDYYEQIVFSLTFSSSVGGGTSAVVSVSLTRIGAICTMLIPYFVINANGGYITSTAIPVRFRPSSGFTDHVIHSINVNTYLDTGAINLNTNGVINICKGVPGYYFSVGAGSGLTNNAHITYTIL